MKLFIHQNHQKKISKLTLLPYFFIFYFLFLIMYLVSSKITRGKKLLPILKTESNNDTDM